jgi:hypothetical protein
MATVWALSIDWALLTHAVADGQDSTEKSSVNMSCHKRRIQKEGIVLREQSAATRYNSSHMQVPSLLQYPFKEQSLGHCVTTEDRQLLHTAHMRNHAVIEGTMPFIVMIRADQIRPILPCNFNLNNSICATTFT